MGTFAGHALPGSFFILFSLWRICDTLKRYFKSRGFEMRTTMQKSGTFNNRISAPVRSVCCRDRRVPLDSFLKFFACLIGLTGEVYTGMDSKWNFVHIGNAQHSTMFITYGLSGFMEVLLFYGVLKTSLNVEYIFMLVALLAEGFLFAFHLHGRTELDIYIHMLFLGIILLSIVAGLLELIGPTDPVVAMLSTYGLLIQGTWFWQVGAILYPAASWMPVWDETAKSSIARAANLFCYHLLIDFAAILAIAIVMSLKYCGSLGKNQHSDADCAPFNQTPAHTIGDEDEELADVRMGVHDEEEMTLYAITQRTEVDSAQ